MKRVIRYNSLFTKYHHIPLAKYSLIPKRDNDENMYCHIQYSYAVQLMWMLQWRTNSYTNNRNDMRSAQESKTSVNTAISVDRSSILRFKKSINVWIKNKKYSWKLQIQSTKIKCICCHHSHRNPFRVEFMSLVFMNVIRIQTAIINKWSIRIFMSSFLSIPVFTELICC